MTKITRVTLTEFGFDVPEMGLETAAAGVGNMAYVKGATFRASRFAVKIDTDAGVSGEYVANWIGTKAAMAQAGMLAPLLIGHDPERREFLFDEMKREVRAYDHMGHGVLDIALWDLCGKLRNAPVKAMLGGWRDRLPTYASTYHGQEGPGGLDTPEAFADFAAECRERGFHGFKIHGWTNGDVARECVNLRGVRARVGEGWRIMLDPACRLKTWADALAVGRVCDEIGAFWYEDPYMDASVSANGQARLREKLATPLLIAEHVRGIELKAGFVLAGGCDMVHVDPEYDLGITGAMKIAHFCEAMGIDLQLHAAGPAQRLCMSAIRQTHMYEMALVGPGMANIIAPVYACGYSDQMADLGEDGCVPVPDGPGLGVIYDRGFIEANRTGEIVCDATTLIPIPDEWIGFPDTVQVFARLDRAIQGRTPGGWRLWITRLKRVMTLAKEATPRRSSGRRMTGPAAPFVRTTCAARKDSRRHPSRPTPVDDRRDDIDGSSCDAIPRRDATM